MVVSGKGFVPPRLIKSVAPIYPKRALSWGIEGIVVIEATTDISGRVTNTRVLKSVPALDKASCTAIKKWVYEPFIYEGRPRPIIFTVTLRFSVSGNSDLSDIEPPELILQVDPVYPEEAKREKIEGTVVLGITIDELGSVSEVRVLESVPGLDQAAIDAVRKWQYTGVWIGGQPVIYSTTVSIKFSLNRAPYDTASNVRFSIGQQYFMRSKRTRRIIRSPSDTP
jgi:TonB family protein